MLIKCEMLFPDLKIVVEIKVHYVEELREKKFQKKREISTLCLLLPVLRLGLRAGLDSCP